MKYYVTRALVWLMPFAMLMGCSPKTIIKEIPVEVKVPVSTPCVVNRPTEPVPLRDTISRSQWDALTTDQRENLAQAQALDRKIFGDKLTVATAGCR